MATKKLARCPKCGRAGTRIASEVSVKGVTIDDSYCGNCGANWPREK